MSNPFANEDLSAFLDGELSDTEAAELQALLDSDPELAADLEALEGAQVFLRTHGPTQAPEGFEARVLALAEKEPAPANNIPAGWRRSLGTFAIAAAAVLVVGVSLQTGVLGGGAVPPAPGALAALKATQPEGTSEVAAGAAAPEADVATPAPRAQSTPAQPVTAGKEQATRSSSSPSSYGGDKTEVAQQLASGTGTAEPAGGEQAQEAAPPAPTAAVQSNASAFGVPYRYTLVTDDPEAMAGLLRLAGRYQGMVQRETGAIVKTAEAQSGTYFVQIPARALAEFGDSLRGLGHVQEVADDRMYVGDNVKVQVDLRIVETTQKKLSTKPAQ